MWQLSYHYLLCCTSIFFTVYFRGYLQSKVDWCFVMQDPVNKYINSIVVIIKKNRNANEDFNARHSFIKMFGSKGFCLWFSILVFIFNIHQKPSAKLWLFEKFFNTDTYISSVIRFFTQRFYMYLKYSVCPWKNIHDIHCSKPQ